MRACREMDLRTVAVFSECDRAALHVRYADEAYGIGPSPPRESYLRIDRIVETARRSGADAVHPGYGFLAENEDFAGAVRDAGLTFIGPSPEAVALMGSKTAARAAAARAGVPLVPGIDAPLAADLPEPAVAEIAAAVGYPLLVKAVAGGGGKGMRTVADPAELALAVRAARSEAGAAFGDTAVYLERRLTRPRHVEVQLLGRSSRDGPSVRGARVLDPAAPPEGRRGDAVAGRDAGAPPGHDVGRRRDRAYGRLHQRRHHRVPAGRGRPFLLSRDEHAAPGRARRSPRW